MSIKKSTSLLIVSALLVLPRQIGKAGDIDVQTNGARVTVCKDGGINIQSRPTEVNVIPHHRAPGSLNLVFMLPGSDETAPEYQPAMLRFPTGALQWI